MAIKFVKHWVNVEIYGHVFNVEVDMSEIGDIKARYQVNDKKKHWMPTFGGKRWKVVSISGIAPFIMEIGVRKQNGKRTSFFRFDVRKRQCIKPQPVTREEMDKLLFETSKPIIRVFSKNRLINGKD